MKKLVLLLTLYMTLLMTACREKNIVPQNDNEEGNVVDISMNEESINDENINSENINGKQDNREDDILDEDNNTAETYKSYYGIWNVTSCICTAPISALTPEEINQLKGTVIMYEEDCFVWNGESCDAPSYQENTETSEDFAQGYNNRLTFSDLGISGKDVTTVMIDNSETFGNYFYLKNADTLIICYNGAFFEAIRNLEGSNPSPGVVVNELCNSNEDIVFGFEIIDSDKMIYLCTAKDQSYLVFRAGTNEKIDIEYPADKTDSWSLFTYSYYFRGGGAENAGLDINYLQFEDETNTYYLYSDYSAEAYDTYTGIIVTNKSTQKETEYVASNDSIIGSLLFFRENDKVNHM